MRKRGRQRQNEPTGWGLRSNNGSEPVEGGDGFGFTAGDDLGIDLGDLDVVMAHEFLDDGEVDAAGQEHGGEGVAADVG